MTAAAPMIRVRRAEKALGLAKIDNFDFPADGRTIGQVLGETYHPAWKPGTKVRVTVNGRPAKQSDLDFAPTDDVWLTALPNTGIALLPIGASVAAESGFFAFLGSVFVTAVLSTAISFAINYAYSALVKHKPKTPQRGDQESPTFSFDGLHTTSGAGFRRPRGYGEFWVPGHVVSSNLRTDGLNEILEQVVVLNDGRIHAIGGLTGGNRGEVDGIGNLKGPGPGPFPVGVKVNGNLITETECEMSLRMGEIFQSPMNGFERPSVVTDVDAELKDAAQIGRVDGLDETAQSFSIRLSFPGGLYEVTAAGASLPYPVGFDVKWTSATSSSVIVRKTVADVYRAGFTQVISMDEIPFTGVGPFTVIVTRVTAGGDASKIISAALFSKVITHRNDRLAYAGSACVGIRIRASEKTTNGQPDYRFPSQLSKIRAWDAALGFTVPTWISPTTGPHAGIWTYPVGRNPAWVLADILTCEEGGSLLPSTKIDWQAFRDWADWCDMAVAVPGGTEMRCSFDGVFDSGGKVGDAVAKVLAAGRAQLVRYGDRISVKYAYRDAHGRGTNVVPPRGGEAFDMPEAVFDTGAMDPKSWRCRRVDPRKRPNVLHFGIINGEIGYEPDDIPVEDEEALQSPENVLLPQTAYRKRISFEGVVRPTQCRREGTFLHKLGRLVRWECEFTTGLQGLPAWPGMIIGIENDSARYFSTNTALEQHHGWRTPAEQLTPASTIVLDHPVVIGASPAWVAFVPAVGTITPQYVTLTAGTYAAGDAIPTSAPIVYSKGVSVTLGLSTKTVRLYEVTSTGLTEDWRRSVFAIEWQPDAYDEASEDVVEFVTDDTITTDWDSPTQVEAEAPGLDIARQILGPDHVVSFSRPDDLRARRARIWKQDEAGLWVLLTETLGNEFSIPGIRPGLSARVAISVQDVTTGSFPSPQAATQFDVIAPEFGASSCPPLQSLEVVACGQGLRLSVAPMDGQDFLYYEWRRGSEWLGAEMLARTNAPSLVVDDVPISSGCTYWAAARFRGGLYSGTPLSVTPAFGGLDHRQTLVDYLDIGTEGQVSGDGTADGVEFIANGGSLLAQLAPGIVRGSYLSTIQDVGIPVTAYWNVAWEGREREDWTMADWDSVAGVDLKWWRGHGREASRGRPGADFDQSIDQWWEANRNTATATIGTNTRIAMDIRFSTDGGLSWSSWEPYRPQWRYAQQCQVRARLDRLGTKWHVQLTRLAVTVQI